MTALLLRLSTALYSLLMLGLPEPFRRAVGREMRETFRDRCRDRLERAGLVGLLECVAANVWDVARVSVEERRRPTVGVPSESRANRNGRGMMFEGLVHDTKQAVRSLRRQPGFAVLAVLMLAVGIGGTTGVYTIVNALLLKPLPGLSEPDRLVALGGVSARSSFSTFPYPVFEAIRDDMPAFTGAVATSRVSLDYRPDGPPERVGAEIVSGGYFDVLGVHFAMGRGFTPDETAAVGGPLVVVASHRAWLERLGGNPAAVGGTVSLNGQPFTLVGITAPDFTGLSFSGSAPEFFVPTSTQPVTMPADGWDPLTSMGDYWVSVVARLADGATVAQAKAQVEAYAASLMETADWELEGAGIVLTPDIAVPRPGDRREIGTILVTLLAVVGVVLAIVCSNLANLLLSRARTRARDMGIRIALGSGRLRVVRQLLIESSLLAVVGGGLGVALAGPTASFIIALYGRALAVEVRPDLSVALLGLGVAVGTGVLFGLVPALEASRPELASSLGERAPGGAGRPRLRRLLAVTQVALSAVLLVGAALFTRSLRNLSSVDPGFDPTGLVATRVDGSAAGLTEVEGRELYRTVVERLAALPGVRSVSLALNSPFGGSMRGGGFLIEGQVPEDGSDYFDSAYNVLWPRYFETMGTPVLRGREFRLSDDHTAPRVAVVSESFARRFWPVEDAVGKRMSREGPAGPWIEIVGVVADAKYGSLAEQPEPFFYLPLLQRAEARVEVVVRMEGPPADLIPVVGSELRALAPNLPTFQIRTMSALLSDSLGRFRLATSITGAFTVLALVLAALGLYGLLSYGVAQRTREIGVRMALGARQAEVNGMVTREGLILTGLGLVVGFVAAAGLTRLVRSFLYDVSPLDPVAFASAAAVLAAVALVACWVPARRASRIDPSEALRAE